MSKREPDEVERACAEFYQNEPLPDVLQSWQDCWSIAHERGKREERERAAKVAESFFDQSDEPADISASKCGWHIAAAIRGGETEAD